MDAVEFLKTYRRICDAHACPNCPLWANKCMVTHGEQFDESKVISTVEQYVKEYLTKTRQSEFLKMYPNVDIDVKDGIIWIYPCNLDIKMREEDKCIERGCTECRRDYWLQEIQEKE